MMSDKKEETKPATASSGVNNNNNIMNGGHNGVNIPSVNDISGIIVSNLFLSKIGDILKEDFKFSASNLFKLLILLASSEIKGIITHFVYQIGGLLKDSPPHIFNFLKNFKNIFKLFRISLLFRKKKLIQNIEIPKPIKTHKCIKNKVSQTFLNALYGYLHENKDGKISFETRVKNTDIKNKLEIMAFEILSNIKIDDIEILEELIFEKNVVSGEIVSVNQIKIQNETQESKEEDRKDPKDLSHFLPANVYKEISDIEEIIYKKIKLDNVYEKLMNCNCRDDDKDYITEKKVMEELMKRYPTLNQKKLLIQLCIFNCVWEQVESDNIIYKLGQSKEVFRGFSHDFKVSRAHAMFSCKNITDSNDMKQFLSCKITFQDQKKIKKYANCINGNKEYNDNDDNDDNDDKEDILITFSVPLSYSNSSLFEFYDKVYKSQKKLGTKIKIFTLMLEKEIIKEEKDNPLYIKYVEEKQKEASLAKKEEEKSKEEDDNKEDKKSKEESPNNKKGAKKGKNNIPQVVGFGHLQGGDFDEFEGVLPVGRGSYYPPRNYWAPVEQIPQKKIINEVIKKTVISKQVSECEKPLNTLYLRKEDKKKLESCLEQFRDKKQLLKDLGLPNKLNVLLAGEPGTGKSSTLIAIATYLNLNIYYVDIQQAETNEDLQKLFDYVNKEVSTGGMIVMEDIDAMTDIVHQRTSTTETCKSATELSKDFNKKITLEYLLNILQGSLTVDGLVFAVTTNHKEKLDKAFIRPGRFDICVDFKLCDHHQISTIYKKMMSRDIPEKLLERILENKYTPADIIFHVKNYIFSQDVDEEILKPFLEDLKEE